MSNSPRRVAAVTSTRADFGLLRWTLEKLAHAADFELQLIVTGTHLAPEWGDTAAEVKATGLPISATVEMLAQSDTPLGTAESMGRTMLRVAPVIDGLRPDIMLLLGDRYEIFAAGAAATALRVPIAHLCGGEKTTGAVDQAWRDGLGKMAHVHLVATSVAAKAVRRMGEEACRIHVVGSPGLESFRHVRRLSRAELSSDLGVELTTPLILATFHPVTNPQPGEPPDAEQLRALLSVLDRTPGTVVFTFANADAGGRAINEAIREFAARRPNTHAIPSLGSERFVQLMLVSDLMCGNSSSALIEAPSAHLPAVNIGSRQLGRLRAANVLDAEPNVDAIAGAFERALHAQFKAGLRRRRNPYGDGRTSDRVVEILRGLHFGRALLSK